MNVFTKTKYEGVYYRESKMKGKIYSIRYRDKGKQIRQTVGSSKEGITPMYCKKLRAWRHL